MHVCMNTHTVLLYPIPNDRRTWSIKTDNDRPNRSVSILPFGIWEYLWINVWFCISGPVHGSVAAGQILSNIRKSTVTCENQLFQPHPIHFCRILVSCHTSPPTKPSRDAVSRIFFIMVLEIRFHTWPISNPKRQKPGRRENLKIHFNGHLQLCRSTFSVQTF